MKKHISWGILGAVNEEIKPIVASLKHKKISRWKIRPIYQGDFQNQQLIVAASGIGQKKAAAAVKYLLDIFSPDAVIFTGTAGAINPDLDMFDLIIGDKIAQPDLTKTSWYASDPALVKLAIRAGEELELGIRIKTGTVLTVAQPIADAQVKKQLRDAFSGDCVEMEGTAVAQLCASNNIPFLIIRAISDFADENITRDFRQAEHRACQDTAALVLKMLSLQ